MFSRGLPFVIHSTDSFSAGNRSSTLTHSFGCFKYSTRQSASHPTKLPVSGSVRFASAITSISACLSIGLIFRHLRIVHYTAPLKTAIITVTCFAERQIWFILTIQRFTIYAAVRTKHAGVRPSADLLHIIDCCLYLVYILFQPICGFADQRAAARVASMLIPAAKAYKAAGFYLHPAQGRYQLIYLHVPSSVPIADSTLHSQRIQPSCIGYNRPDISSLVPAGSPALEWRLRHT